MPGRDGAVTAGIFGLFSRRHESVEPPLKLIRLITCTNVPRIQMQGLTGGFEGQFPVPCSMADRSCDLPGVLGNNCSRKPGSRQGVEADRSGWSRRRGDEAKACIRSTVDRLSVLPSSAPVRRG